MNRWEPTRELRQLTRCAELEDLGGITAIKRQGLGFGGSTLYGNQTNEQRKQTIKDLVATSEAESKEVELVQSAIHGGTTTWEKVMPRDWDWKAFLYGLSPSLLKFHINTVGNSLPSPDNLHRWNLRSTRVCALYGAKSATLLHILNNCEVALNQGRYNWRHDHVLKEIDAVVAYR